MNRYWPMLLTLAAVWGASYLFIKVAVDEIDPAPMMAFRTLLAAAVLLGYIVWRLGRETAFGELRAAWRHCLVLGVLNAALPFWLIAWGEQYIDSGLAAVVQASVPIFNALLVLRFLPHERLTANARASALAIGIAGVAVVTGIHPERRQPGDSRRARRRPLLALLRLGRHLRPAGRLRHRGAGPGGRVDAHGRADPAAVRALPGADVGAVGGGDRLGAGPLAARHRARAADPLPHARPARLGAALARHLPDARLRARLRSVASRRGDHRGHDRRARADPRRRRARLGRRAASPARGRPQPGRERLDPSGCRRRRRLPGRALLGRGRAPVPGRRRGRTTATASSARSSRIRSAGA